MEWPQQRARGTKKKKKALVYYQVQSRLSVGVEGMTDGLKSQWDALLQKLDEIESNGKNINEIFIRGHSLKKKKKKIIKLL